MKAIKPKLKNALEKAPSVKPIRTLGPVSDLEKHLPANWMRPPLAVHLKTDNVLGEDKETVQADVDLLVRTVGLSPEDEILDLCCSQGQHALELARRGYTHVQGVDRSRHLIRLARKQATDEKLKIQLSEGDARRLRMPENSKDCVFIMGNSFAYFEREEDDQMILRSIRKVLRSNGRLVMDLIDGDWLAQNFEPRSWEWLDSKHLINRERSLSSDGKRLIVREVVTHVSKGVIADQFYAERLHTLDEVAAQLDEMGFEGITNITPLPVANGGEQNRLQEHRLIILATLPEKRAVTSVSSGRCNVAVVLGDPSLPDPVKRGGKYNEEDFETVEKAREALSELAGYNFTYLNEHKSLIKQLMNDPPQLVLNLCDEGYQNNARLELHVPAILDMLNIPYTGAGPGCLYLCYDKAKVRAIAASMGVPVPLETFCDPTELTAQLPSTFPAFIKPACADNSVGITQNSIVHNAKELVEYMDYIRTILPGTPILIQEYLQGAEYGVGLVGNPGHLEALPIMEVDYSKLPSHLPKILSYESKYHPDSPYWNDIQSREPDLDEDMRNRLITYAKILFERMDCRDYARFDFRCDSEGVPKLLEVNPNPGWCWDGKLNLMANTAGISYSGLLDLILKAAMERAGLSSGSVLSGGR